MDQPSADIHHVGSTRCHRNTGLDKRTQGRYVASFLVHVVAQKLQREASGHDESESNTNFLTEPSQWAQQYDNILSTKPSAAPSSQQQKQQHQLLLQKARNYLNQDGRGVLDVAGGSGYISMALSLMGVRCTVVDPRENVGRLPKRDRKIYHHAVMNNPPPSNETQGVLAHDGGESSYCQLVKCPVIPFDVMRAWFGLPPDGVDRSFRQADQEVVPVLHGDMTLARFSAIVALHPDEATDAIVSAAVRWRIPFAIVPCCVFCRLFPYRQKPNGDPVSTREDLFDFLMAKDSTIQKTTLPFEGANTILWSYFEDTVDGN